MTIDCNWIPHASYYEVHSLCRHSIISFRQFTHHLHNLLYTEEHRKNIQISKSMQHQYIHRVRNYELAYRVPTFDKHIPFWNPRKLRELSCVMPLNLTDNMSYFNSKRYINYGLVWIFGRGFQLLKL